MGCSMRICALFFLSSVFVETQDLVMVHLLFVSGIGFSTLQKAYLIVRDAHAGNMVLCVVLIMQVHSTKFVLYELTSVLIEWSWRIFCHGRLHKSRNSGRCYIFPEVLWSKSIPWCCSHYQYLLHECYFFTFCYMYQNCVFLFCGHQWAMASFLIFFEYEIVGRGKP